MSDGVSQQVSVHAEQVTTPCEQVNDCMSYRMSDCMSESESESQCVNE